MKITGKSILKILFVLLVLAVIGLATTLIYIVIRYDISLGSPENETNTLVIGIVSPYGDGTFFKDADLRLPDEETAIEFVLYDFETKKSYAPEELGFSYEDFALKWENRFIGVESELDGTWPLYNDYDKATMFNAYSLSVEYTGAESENYTVMSNTVNIVCKNDYTSQISQFEEETVYAYPGRECVMTLMPHFENSEVVIKTFGNVSNSIVVKNGDEVIAVSENAAEENSVRFFAEGIVRVIVKNESEVNESFTLYAGYESIFDSLGSDDGMDIALAPHETKYIQIDSESDDSQIPPSDGYNVYDVSVTAAPFVNFEVYAYTPQKGYNSEFGFSGSEEAISASFVCDFYRPALVAITNDSDSETVVNVVIKKSEDIVFTDDPADIKSTNVLFARALAIRLPSSGKLKLVLDEFHNEGLKVMVIDYTTYKIAQGLLKSELVLNVSKDSRTIWITNPGSDLAKLTISFTPDG